MVVPGNCIYGSGSGHLVDRKLSGPFAQCGSKQFGSWSEMDQKLQFYNPSECDTTFIGGYSNMNYDPRYKR